MLVLLYSRLSRITTQLLVFSMPVTIMIVYKLLFVILARVANTKNIESNLTNILIIVFSLNKMLVSVPDTLINFCVHLLTSYFPTVNENAFK